MVDSVYRTRSLGVGTEGLPDQYADGRAAKVWELYVGDKNSRTDKYKTFLLDVLKKHNCHHVLDVACGTGIDSILLLESGFKVTSVDASDKMLKYALKQRWSRRKEKAFDEWEIDEANWLTLPQDLDKPGDGYDAVICMGNSFAHLPAWAGDQTNQKVALRNIYNMAKPGGIILIDHRNYDYIIDNGRTPTHNVYYNSKHVKDIQTSVLYQNGIPSLITLDYVMDISAIGGHLDENGREALMKQLSDHFRLSYYPHRLKGFSQLLKETCGEKSSHKIYGDFKEISEAENPAFYVHVIQRDSEK